MKQLLKGGRIINPENKFDDVADLLIEDGATLHAVEIKAGATMRSDHFDGLAYLQGITPLKPEHSSVVWAGDLEVETAHGRYISYKHIGRV